MTLRPGDDVTTGTTPGLQLHLLDSDDEPLDEVTAGERRPSTASLSRFRSCPQLSSADTKDQDSPGSDDGLGLGSELHVGSVHFTHGSPRARQRDDAAFHGERSGTPTPPSSPGSKRSHVSVNQTLAASGARGAGEAAMFASRALGRARLEHALLGRTASLESQPAEMSALRHMEDGQLRPDDQYSERGGRPLSEFFEEPPDVSLDGRLTATEDGGSAPLGGERRGYHADHDSMDKCARWLQSLKMSSTDRLKSRSHIQLPPI